MSKLTVLGVLHDNAYSLFVGETLKILYNVGRVQVLEDGDLTVKTYLVVGAGLQLVLVLLEQLDALDGK